MPAVNNIPRTGARECLSGGGRLAPVVYHVAGDLTKENAEAVHRELDELLAASDRASQKWTVFKLDLTEAKMVDSVGLHLIVSLLKCVLERGAKMQIAYSNEHILRILMFSRLHTQVKLVEAPPGCKA